jgi:hypothetical protein
MVQKKAAAGKKGLSKLKLKKETVRDLDARKGAGKVRGGVATGSLCLRISGTTCVRKDV